MSVYNTTQRRDKYKAVYVLYPRGVETGGPEALHQLVHTLRKQGIEAYLVPSKETLSSHRSPSYSIYDAPESEVIPDESDVAVVIPEVYGHRIDEFKHVDIYLWWLSIDNSVFFRDERVTALQSGRQDWLRRPANIKRRLRSLRMRRVLRNLQKQHVHHLVQSRYAWEFLAVRLNITASPLTDWTTAEGPAPVPNKVSDKQQRIVISYNPAKGGRAVDSIRMLNRFDVDWRPIQHMSRPEVAALLQTSDIYLDLGHHPGKDRLPREAAASGAVVVLAKQGAGRNFIDSPIPNAHKVDAAGRIVDAAVDVLDNVMADIPAAHAAQSSYRVQISKEKEIFEREVERIFTTRTLRGDFDLQIFSIRE